MAKRNEEVPLGVPAGGIRRDLAEYQIPPTACRYAENVIVHGGALRPRPALVDVGFDTPQTSPWPLLFTEASTASYAIHAPIYNHRRREFLIATYVDGTATADTIYVASEDDPANWTDTGESASTLGFSTGLPEHNCRHLRSLGILAHVKSVNGAGTDTVTLDIVWAPDTWPDAGSWTTESGIAGPYTGGVMNQAGNYFLASDGSLWAITWTIADGFARLWHGTPTWQGGGTVTWVEITRQSTGDHFHPTYNMRLCELSGYVYIVGGWDDGTTHALVDSTPFLNAYDLNGTLVREYTSPFVATTHPDFNPYTAAIVPASLDRILWVGFTNPTIDEFGLRRLDISTDTWVDLSTFTGTNVPSYGVLCEARDTVVLIGEYDVWYSYDGGLTVTKETLASRDFSFYPRVAAGEKRILMDGARYDAPTPYIHDVREVLPFKGGSPLSFHQFEADFRHQAIVSICEEAWRLLEPDGSWLILDQDTAIDVSGYSDRPVFRTFPKGGKTYLVATSLVQGVRSWDTSLKTNQVKLESSAPASRACMVLANRMLLLNGPNNSPAGTDASDFNDFATGYGTVQVSLIGDSSEPIVGGWETSALEGTIMKEDAIYAAIAQVEFGGVAAPFRFEARKVGINGPPSPQAVLRMTDGSLIYMGVDGGIYRWDNVSVQEFAPQARYIIEKQMDYNRKAWVWAMLDPVKQLAWWWYPNLDGSMNRAIILDIMSGAIWEHVLPAGWVTTCGGSVFIRKDVTIGELTRPIGEYRVPLSSLSSENRIMLMALSDDRWGRHMWSDDETNNYHDLDEPVTVAWSPGWHPLQKSYRTYATLHRMLHLFHSPEDQQVTFQPIATERGLVRKEGPARTISQSSPGHDVRLTGRLFTYEASGAISSVFYHEGMIAEASIRGER